MSGVVLSLCCSGGAPWSAARTALHEPWSPGCGSCLLRPGSEQRLTGARSALPRPWGTAWGGDPVDLDRPGGSTRDTGTEEARPS